MIRTLALSGFGGFVVIVTFALPPPPASVSLSTWSPKPSSTTFFCFCFFASGSTGSKPSKTSSPSNSNASSRGSAAEPFDGFTETVQLVPASDRERSSATPSTNGTSTLYLVRGFHFAFSW